MRQRGPQAYAAHELLVKIARRVVAPTEVKRSGNVLQVAGWSEDLGPAFHGGIQRGCVDKWFEHGSGLTLRQHVIQLAGPVTAPADQRLNLPGMRIDRNQRDLRL